MVKIRWTNESEKWLKDIHDYIAQDKPQAARNVVSGIYKKAQILCEFPEIGYKYRSKPEGDVRILLYGSLPNRIFDQKHGSDRYSWCIPWSPGFRKIHAVK